ncbi:MAG: 30S ribosomal protein S2 [Patescibacteria group bacterium]|nr:30S ribosomal protein S2 [Patescibacteria group bacterium]
MAGKTKKETGFKIEIEEMAKAGVHFGHKKSKFHPKMEPYLHSVRNTIHIIDLEKTKEKLEEALEFIKKLVQDDKVLLIIGTKIQVKDLVKDFAIKFNFPYVNERWLGGSFTNFKVIKNRIDHFKEIEEKKQKGELKKYTKKERSKIDQQLEKFEKKFGGIRDLDNLPDVIFVLDMKKDALAVKEAIERGVKIIGISDSNTNPTLADFPIPANDDALSSVKYILDKVSEVVKKAKTLKKKKKQTVSDEKKETTNKQKETDEK